MSKRRKAIEIAVPNKIAKKMRRANLFSGDIRRKRAGLRFGELARHKPGMFFSLREKLRGR